MKKILLLSFIALATTWTAGQALAQSPFEGTWKLDVSSIKETSAQKPSVLLLQNGVYECKDCPWKGKADGTDQPVTGVPSFNTIAVNVKDDHTLVLTFKKDGKTVMTNHMMVSKTGDLLTQNVSQTGGTNGGSPRLYKITAKRISKGPTGAHLISGTWEHGKLVGMSDNLTTWTYKFNGNEVTETTPGGESFTAKLNGPAAPMKNNPDVTTVSVKMLGDRTLQETDMRDGKVTAVMTMSLSADHKTAAFKAEDKEENSITEARIIRQ